MTPDQIVALIAALTAQPDPSAFSVLKAGGANPDYPVVVEQCARPVAPDEIDGETVICGKVTVPFDHRNPDGDKITIAFNLYKAHSLSPEPDPMIYLHGGPGDGTVRRVGWTVGNFEHLRQRRDIIAIDERGVDSSAPEMDCFQTLSEELETALPLRDIGTDALAQLEPEFVKSCLAELDARGIDYSLINTEQNAMDVPAVISALGYETWNIYGISYGTKLTQEVIRQNPPGIRAVVIDGNAPPWLPLYSSFWQAHSTAIQQSLGPCELDPVCAEAYPNIVERTFALFEKLFEEPVQGSEDVIGPDVLYSIIDGRGTFNGPYRGLTPYIPLMVKQLEEGDTTLIDQLSKGELPPKHGTPETVRAAAAAAGLRADEMGQVDEMLAAAEHIRIAEKSVTRAAAALEAGRDADARGTEFAELVDSELGNAIRSLPTAEAQYDAYRAYLQLRFVQPSKSALTTFVQDHLNEASQASLLGLINQLSDSDLARLFDRVRTDNQALSDDVEGQFQTLLYACQEDFSDGWNSVEKLQRSNEADGSWGPNMVQVMTQFFSGIINSCGAFEKHPRANWTVPVSTDLPVLSMNGELDRNTAAVWGKAAIQDFSNARYVQIPESGHGTILFSQCARDITAAFIENPEGELDTSCVAAERPPFMMPDGTMHKLSY